MRTELKKIREDEAAKLARQEEQRRIDAIRLYETAQAEREAIAAHRKEINAKHREQRKARRKKEGAAYWDALFKRIG